MMLLELVRPLLPAVGCRGEAFRHLSVLCLGISMEDVFRLFYVCTYDDEVLEFGYCCDDTTCERIKNFLAKARILQEQHQHRSDKPQARHITMTREVLGLWWIYMSFGLYITESPLISGVG